MIPRFSSKRRAYYADDGSIILPSAGDETDPIDLSEQHVAIDDDAEESAEESVEDIIAAVDAAAVSRAPRNRRMHDAGAADEAAGAQEEAVPVAEDAEPLLGAEPEEEGVQQVPVTVRMRERTQALLSTVSRHGGEAVRQSGEALLQVTRSVQTLTTGFIAEGSRQYLHSARDTAQVGSELYEGSKSFIRRTWEFMLQPVWVPGRKAVPKQRSRGTLFLFDVVRFGGTFAGIFAGLFIVLNYQSFWEIARARMEPLNQASLTTNDPVGRELEKILVEETESARPEVAAGANLFSYVPPVGPPRPQLIIPKLGLNVPIVIPSSDELVAQNWKGLEEQIQLGLEAGVVHYPGTADAGQGGNFFLTGHSSYYPWAAGHYKTVFARLGDLSIGDEYWVYYKGDKHRYIVTEKKEVKPSEVSVLDQPTDRRIGTLMTCTPVGTTLRRLIVRAQEVDPITGEPLEVGEHGTQEILPKVRVEVLPI